MRVMKKGKIVDIPVKRGTVVKLRDSNGRLTGAKGIVMSNVPASAFSRAYGRQVNVCIFHGKGGRGRFIMEKGAGDLYPVGQVKKIPKTCRQAVAEDSTVRTRRRKGR